MTHIQIPSVPPQIIAWVHKHASKNYWRVAGLCDWDDLIAEGYFSIAYCLNRYGTGLDPPHLMRLVQITFNCAITDIARKRTKLAETKVEDLVSEGKEDFFWSKIAGTDVLPEVYRLVAEAPDLVRRALVFLLTDTKGLMRESYIKGEDGVRELTSERLCRVLKINVDIPIMNQIREYLKK